MQEYQNETQMDMFEEDLSVREIYNRLNDVLLRLEQIEIELAEFKE